MTFSYLSTHPHTCDSFVRGAKHRFGVRSCCDLVAEIVGPMAACYRTGGTMLLLGTDGCYDGLSVPNYASAYKTFDHTTLEDSIDDIVGPGIAGGMTGGRLILPRLLDKKIREQDYYARCYFATYARNKRICCMYVKCMTSNMKRTRCFRIARRDHLPYAIMLLLALRYFACSQRLNADATPLSAAARVHSPL